MNLAAILFHILLFTTSDTLKRKHEETATEHLFELRPVNNSEIDQYNHEIYIFIESLLIKTLINDIQKIQSNGKDYSNELKEFKKFVKRCFPRSISSMTENNKNVKLFFISMANPQTKKICAPETEKNINIDNNLFNLIARYFDSNSAKIRDHVKEKAYSQNDNECPKKKEEALSSTIDIDHEISNEIENRINQIGTKNEGGLKVSFDEFLNSLEQDTVCETKNTNSSDYVISDVPSESQNEQTEIATSKLYKKQIIQNNFNSSSSTFTCVLLYEKFNETFLFYMKDLYAIDIEEYEKNCNEHGITTIIFRKNIDNATIENKKKEFERKKVEYIKNTPKRTEIEDMSQNRDSEKLIIKNEENGIPYEQKKYFVDNIEIDFKHFKLRYMQTINIKIVFDFIKNEYESILKILIDSNKFDDKLVQEFTKNRNGLESTCSKIDNFLESREIEVERGQSIFINLGPRIKENFSKLKIVLPKRKSSLFYDDVYNYKYQTFMKKFIKYYDISYFIIFSRALNTTNHKIYKNNEKMHENIDNIMQHYFDKYKNYLESKSKK